MEIKLKEEEKIKILNGDDVYSIMQKVLQREDKIEASRKHVWVISLAKNNRILNLELISIGNEDLSTLKPMHVFSLALEKKSAKLILIQNSPIDELEPTEEDKDITDRLIQVGRIVNLEFYDHLIITDKSYLSFKSQGLVKQLSRSLKYVPPYMQEERMKEIAKMDVIELENKLLDREQEKTRELAKQMLEEGDNIEKIMRYTKMSIEAIERLKEDE